MRLTSSCQARPLSGWNNCTAGTSGSCCASRAGYGGASTWQSDLSVPALHEPSVLDGVRSATALCTWVRARGAAVESLSIENVPVCARLRSVGGLAGGCAACAHQLHALLTSEWEPAVLTSSNLSWLCAELGKCRSLRELDAAAWTFQPGWGVRFSGRSLRHLTSLDCYSRQPVTRSMTAVPVPACVPSLPRLQSLKLVGFPSCALRAGPAGTRCSPWTSDGCSPAERGFALQALPSLTSLELCWPVSCSSCPAACESWMCLWFEEDELTQDSVTCVRSSLRVLKLGDVHRFPARVTGLSNLRHLELCFRATCTCLQSCGRVQG